MVLVVFLVFRGTVGSLGDACRVMPIVRTLLSRFYQRVRDSRVSRWTRLVCACLNGDMDALGRDEPVERGRYR
jgi:hypothetical protein